ncbi:MAG: tetratricopeptide repeat protein [Pseudomonadota bacterium]
MSNTDSDNFIQEVTEEVERDRMNRQLKKWGPLVGAGALALVGIFAIWEWQKTQAREAAEDIGAILLSEDLADPTQAETAVAALEGPPAMLAALRLAEAQLAAGNIDAAVETYLGVGADPAVPPAYGDLAILRAARIQATDQDPNGVIATLEPIAAEGRPYRLLAQEMIATLKLNLGETAEAHEMLNAILADETRTGGLEARARQLLVSSGGEPAR